MKKVDFLHVCGVALCLQVLKPQTGAESFHKHFGKLFGQSKPNIFAFLENLFFLKTKKQNNKNPHSASSRSKPI